MEHSEIIQLITPPSITLVIGFMAGALVAWFIQHFRLKRDPDQTPGHFRELNRKLTVLQVDKARLGALCEECDNDRMRLLAVDSITEKQLQIANDDLATAWANIDHLKEQLTAKQGDLENMHQNLLDRLELLTQGVHTKPVPKKPRGKTPDPMSLSTTRGKRAAR